MSTSSAIVYFDNGQNISHDLYDLIESWDPIPGYLKKALQTVPYILHDLSCQQISSHPRGLIPYSHSCSGQQNKLV